MPIDMRKRFMIQNAAAGYGYRVWLLEDEFEMLQLLKPLSMWGAVDKRYRESNGTAIASYEITPYDNNANLDKVRAILRNGGFEEYTNKEDMVSVFQRFSCHH